jgi:hypothetical protein
MSTFDFRKDILPFLIATVGEFSALTLWLMLSDSHQIVWASVALWIGFAIERIAVAAWVRSVYAPGEGITSDPLWKTGVFLLVITGLELAIWSWWRLVAERSGVVIAGVELLVLIHALHSLEMGAVKRQSPLVYVVNTRTIFFSIMEAAGATGWLALRGADQAILGALCLLVGLTVEHIVQGSLLKPDVAATPVYPR